MPPPRSHIGLPTLMNDQTVDEDARLAVMSAILFISLFAVSFPGLSKQLPFLKIPHLVFFIGKHFGTGAILATAFCHLLPDAFASLQKPDVDQTYNGISKWTGLIIMGSILVIFLVEYISTSYVDHLHSKPSAPASRVSSVPPSRSKSPLRPTEATVISAGPSSDSHLRTPIPCGSPNCIRASTERTPLLQTPTTRVPKRERARSLGNLDDDALLPLVLLTAPRLSRGGSLHSRLSRWGYEEACVCHMRVMHAQAHEVGAVFDDDEQPGKEDMTQTIGRKRQVVGILILQSGIMIHSLVIGLTLAITSGVDFTSLVTAITFHQLFEGLSLGIRIAGLPPSSTAGPRWLAPTLSILFAVTTPLGMVGGMLAFPSTRAGESVLLHLTQGLMAAISAGMLIYASTVEMLAGDFVFGDVGGNHGHGHGLGHGLGQQDEDEDKDEHSRSAVKKKVLAVASLLMGAIAMALVGLGE